MHHINESIFLVYCGHFSSVIVGSMELETLFLNLWRVVLKQLEMCKGPCGSKEWNGCFVKQQVISDKSYWSPKSDFSLVLLLNVNVGHRRNAIFHPLRVRSPVPVLSPI